MTKNSSNRLIAVSSAVAALAFIALSVQPASASINGKLERCAGASQADVLSCCQGVTQDRRPFWMTENHANCNTPGVVVCKGSSSRSISLASANTSVVTRHPCFVQFISRDGNENGTPNMPTPKQTHR